MIYWDHNATTPIEPQALAALDAAWKQQWANPASLHHAGRTATECYEQTLRDLSRQLGCCFGGAGADHLIWESSGSAANRTALESLARDQSGQILVGATEHPSIIDMTAELGSRGHVVATIPVGTSGTVDLDALAESLQRPTRLAVIQWVNHETGVIQPIESIARLCHEAGACLHVDAVQAIGKIPCDFRGFDIDSLTWSSHKVGGPRGLAGWLANDRVLPPHRWPILEAGTPPLELAMGFAKALEVATRPASATRLRQLRDRLESLLLAEFPDATVHGLNAERVGQTLSIAFPPLDRQAMLMALDLAGVCCSAGSACASGSAEPAPSLLAMGIDPNIVRSSLRFSLGHTTTAEEVERGAGIVLDTVRKLLAKVPSHAPHSAPGNWHRPV